MCELSIYRNQWSQWGSIQLCIFSGPQLNFLYKMNLQFLASGISLACQSSTNEALYYGQFYVGIHPSQIRRYHDPKRRTRHDKRTNKGMKLKHVSTIMPLHIPVTSMFEHTTMTSGSTLCILANMNPSRARSVPMISNFIPFCFCTRSRKSYGKTQSLGLLMAEKTADLIIIQIYLITKIFSFLQSRPDSILSKIL